MNQRIEAIRDTIKNSILGSPEELNKPSPLSIRIRGTKIPGREILADTVERARFCALGPINLARVVHEQVDMQPVLATFTAMGLPAGVGLMTMIGQSNINIPLATAVAGASYMIEGYFITNQSCIDDTFSRTARRVASIFRRTSVPNSII